MDHSYSHESNSIDQLENFLKKDISYVSDGENAETPQDSFRRKDVLFLIFGWALLGASCSYTKYMYDNTVLSVWEDMHARSIVMVVCSIFYMIA